jgi:hypothetical protein
MVEKRNAYRFMIGNMKERDHLGDFGINGWIILKWSSRNRLSLCQLKLYKLMTVCFEHSNYLSGSYNVQNFLITDVTIGLLRRALVHGVSKLFCIEFCQESCDWTVIEFIKVYYVDEIFWARTIVMV